MIDRDRRAFIFRIVLEQAPRAQRGPLERIPVTPNNDKKISSIEHE